MRRVRIAGRWLASHTLSLILRIPFMLGMLAGFLALCVVAFMEGYYRVYAGGRG